MKHLLALLIVIFIAGCNGRVVTTTVHQVVNDRNLDEPVGYFEVHQARYESDRSDWSPDYRQIDRNRGSDLVVEFHNTCNRAVSFNFSVTGQGWHLRDAVVNLDPNQVYSSQRINAPYNSLDYWRVAISGATFAKVNTKREIPLDKP